MNGKIRSENGRILVSVDTSIYPYDCLAKAVSMFPEKIGICNCDNENRFVSISINPGDNIANSEEVSGDFFNLLLTILKNR